MSLRRATGQAAFAGDILLPGTLHLALRRSPLAHARVVRADARAAAALPGVALVLCAGDEGSPLSPVQRYVGDRVAVAAAEEAELARRAVDLAEIALEPLPAVLDAEAAARDEATVAARVSAATGDVESALAGAQHVVEGEWSLPFTPAVSLEPPLAMTWLDEDRRLVVRTSAESPFRVRGVLADRLSLPAARIRVVRPLVAGGSFGRAELVVEDLCALVTLRTGRPARLALSAEEELTTTPGRPAQRVRVRLGLDEGRLSALDIQLLVDLGAGGEGALELLRSCGRHALGLYRIPNLRFEATAVRTNRPPASAPPGGDAGAAFAVECAVDEAAARLEEDPATFRRQHLRAAGDPGGDALEALGEPRGRDDARAIAELLRVGARDGGRPRRWRPFVHRRPGSPRQRGRHRTPGHRRGRRRGGLPAPPRRRLLHARREPVGGRRDRRGRVRGGGRRHPRGAAAPGRVRGRRHRLRSVRVGDAAPAYFSAGRAVEDVGPPGSASGSARRERPSWGRPRPRSPWTTGASATRRGGWSASPRSVRPDCAPATR